ncbi:hypothetical protein HDU67_005757, partial [Dinochytrium kinnereticum]
VLHDGKDGVLLGAGIVGKGLKDAATYDHYSVLKTIEENFSLGNLGTKDVSAKLIPLIAGTCGGNATTTAVTPPPITFSATTTATSIVAPTSTVTSLPCAHSLCVTGVALKPSCDACVAKIVAADSYCGRTKWDATCIAQ